MVAPAGWVMPVIAFFLLQSCAEMRLQSIWPAAGVVIDGDSGEWLGRLYRDAAHNVAVGVMNDSSSLYLCILSYDRALSMQMRRGGFIIRFGGKKDNRGIRFITDSRRVNRPGEGTGMLTMVQMRDSFTTRSAYSA